MNAFQRGLGGILCIGLLGGAAWAGDLNPPPGPVLPTDDVVLNSQAIALPYTITQPGAYRLTSNFVGSPTDGIQIQSDDVWLDLGGFTLDGAGALGDGIVMQGPFHNCTILNGTVINWGDDGIDLSQGTDNKVINVNARQNLNEGIEAIRTEVIDCMTMSNGNGILAFDHSLVIRCRVVGSGSYGIQVDNGSKVENCTVQRCGIDGISAIAQCLVIECTSSDNALGGFGVGIIAGEHSKIDNCTAARNFDGIVNFIGGLVVDCVSTENQNIGIFTDLGGLVTNCKASRNTNGFDAFVGAKLVECTAFENNQYGFNVDAGTTVRECNAGSNQTSGIFAMLECEIDNNHCWLNGGGETGAGNAGIEIAGSGNRISNNDCKNNPANYLDNVGGNTYFGNSSHQPSLIPGPGFPHYAVIGAPVNDLGPITQAQFGPPAYANIWYP